MFNLPYIFCLTLFIYYSFFSKLKKEFNIQGIPALIVVKKDGTIVSTNGRSDVERKGSNAVKGWMK